MDISELKKAEKFAQKYWERTNEYQTVPDDREKYFITFPYPYMNGRLHIGHAYSLTKAEFTARYWRLKGKNVLFPFAFHGTGMPIVACADKLKRDIENGETSPDINNQYNIMRKMGIPVEEIPKFQQPEYWLEYFPVKAVEDLKKFGTSADFSRSFITTKLNPYYDSFVRWQFNKLYQQGKLYFGKRYSIYSPKDEQPCADHDRSVGEGVGPKQFRFVKLEWKGFGDWTHTYLLSTIADLHVSEVLNIKVNPNTVYGVYELSDEVAYISNERGIRNLTYQLEEFQNIKKMWSIVGIDIIGKNVFFDGKMYKVEDTDVMGIGTGIYSDVTSSPDKIIETIPYWEPEDTVISRSNDECVVALTDQWYLKYGMEDWKHPVSEYINNGLITYNKVTKKMFQESIEWLGEWACSRSYGLGTDMPCHELETTCLIDSLSDSTIYMAFYTIAHKIKKYPVKELTDEVWDWIFLLNDDDIHNKYQELRDEFRYWYPVDLRVSGKDLINNHLTMCLYNHAAIWGKNMCPRSYFTNGHVMINGDKMSKSSGNFYTMDEIVEKYSADATRFALAIAGEELNDANFSESVAENAVNKLDQEMRWVIDQLTVIDSDVYRVGELVEADIIFQNEINKAVSDIDKYYQQMRFREVTECFVQLNISKKRYMKTDQHRDVILNYIHMKVNTLSPICPHWSCYLSNLPLYQKWIGGELKFPEVVGEVEWKLLWQEEYLCKLKQQISKMSKRGEVQIGIAGEFLRDWEEEMMIVIDNLVKEREVGDSAMFNDYVVQYFKSEDHKWRGMMKEIMPFLVYIRTCIKKYGMGWYECLRDNDFNEVELINKVFGDIRSRVYYKGMELPFPNKISNKFRQTAPAIVNL